MIKSLQFHPLVLGFLLVVLAAFWAGRSWGHIDDDVQGDGTVASCRG